MTRSDEKTRVTSFGFFFFSQYDIRQTNDKSETQTYLTVVMITKIKVSLLVCTHTGMKAEKQYEPVNLPVLKLLHQ